MIQINTLKGYEEVLDIYFIDKKGLVFSTKLNDYLKNADNGKGYKIVSLKIQGKRKWKKAYIHRLVALAYIDNPLSKEEVNHMDEDKSNNDVTNLEWVTKKENNNYGTKIQRMQETRCEKIYVYDYLLNFKGEFLGVANATKSVLGYIENRALNKRVKEYFFFNKKPTIKNVIDVNKNSKYQTVAILNIHNGVERIFPFNRRARDFFDGKVNITNAIKKGWLVRKTYKIYEFDYNRLKDSPNLQE